jgi:hypothetical protein
MLFGVYIQPAPCWSLACIKSATSCLSVSPPRRCNRPRLLLLINFSVELELDWRQLRAGRFRVRIPAALRDLSLLGPTQSPVQWVPKVGRPGREANHSPTSSTYVKKKWSHRRTENFPWGGGGLTRRLYIMSDFKNGVTKIMPNLRADF